MHYTTLFSHLRRIHTCTTLVSYVSQYHVGMGCSVLNHQCLFNHRTHIKFELGAGNLHESPSLYNDSIVASLGRSFERSYEKVTAREKYGNFPT